MRAVEISTFSSLMSRTLDRSPAEFSPAPVVKPVAAPIAEYRAESADRKMILSCSLVILALINLNVMMWTGAISARIAEWAGVSFATSAWIGLIAIPAAVPLVVAITLVAWRRIIR